MDFINKTTLMHVFQFFLALTVLISFYMLIEAIYHKSYRNVSCWRFPMLLAIFIETFII